MQLQKHAGSKEHMPYCEGLAVERAGENYELLLATARRDLEGRRRSKAHGDLSRGGGRALFVSDSEALGLTGDCYL